jgi:hypothetical protein
MIKARSEMGGACSAHGEVRNAYKFGWKISVLKTTRKTRFLWEYNTKTDLREIGFEGVAAGIVTVGWLL